MTLQKRTDVTEGGAEQTATGLDRSPCYVGCDESIGLGKKRIVGRRRFLRHDIGPIAP